MLFTELLLGLYFRDLAFIFAIWPLFSHSLNKSSEKHHYMERCKCDMVPSGI